MRRQRRSFTDIICENCKYLPTKRYRNKRKPIPKESDVKTFNYTAHLWDIRWLRHRARKRGFDRAFYREYFHLVFLWF
ncbi:NinE family protein [Escherichia coli]|nr:NinE family protein [Escherichia coli]